MAYNFDHPSFNWDCSDLFQEFSRFKEHCSFVFSGPLSEATDKQKCGWLGTWIGAQGREIYKTFSFDTEEEKNNFDTVLNKFELYVRPKRNKRISRHKLKQRKQRHDETFINFVKDLRLIIMDCDYSDPDDIIVDNVIDGVYDKRLQEKFLDRGESLTISKAMELGQQFELSQRQLKLVREDPTLTNVSAIKTHQTSFRPASNQTNTARSNNSPCMRCGRYHDANSCPASNSACSYCKTVGHWKAVCRKRASQPNRLQKRQLHTVNQEDGQFNDKFKDLELYRVFTLSDNNSNTDKWVENVQIQGNSLPFRIDTGAKCNTITLETLKRLNFRQRLNPPTNVLRTFSGHLIRPVGTIDLPITCKSTTIVPTFQVLDIQQENILSGDTAEQLGLINRVDNVTTISDIADNTGVLPGEYSIKLDPNISPVVHAPRRYPPALRQKINEKLHEMENNGYITKVTEPTEWVSSMVVVSKNDKVRICLDPRDLNKAIKREHHPMRTIEDVVREIPNATVFSVLDAKNGYLQIMLDEQSSMLTTFNTPNGRYRWLRLPFGLVCSAEIFQRIMDTMIEGIDGAFAIVDDILIAGRDINHHNEIFHKVLQRAKEYNLKFNMDKLNIRKSSVQYCGHLITSTGLKPDPTKVDALRKMPKPVDKESLRRFLGFITYLSKFIPNFSEESESLRTLLKSDVSFDWQNQQDKAFNRLIELCCNTPVLQYYDTNKPVEIHCDSSSTGLGAVLIQNNQPVAYTSRALTDTECRYAQIEKEMLSIVHACKKFHCFIFGTPVTVYNDHKPLEQIFKKPLMSAPMRLQRMLLSLQWYDIQIVYRPGKYMQLPDTLSRAVATHHVDNNDNDNFGFNHICMLHYVSMTPEKNTAFVDATRRELSELYNIILHGWPDNKANVPFSVKCYYPFRSELSVSDGLIFKGMRLVVPPCLRKEMINLIHENHLGIVKCKQRAREVLYWPSMNSDIEECIKACSACMETSTQQQRAPLMPSSTPDYPFSHVSVDIFEFENNHFLITVDYYSKFIQIAQLTTMTSANVVTLLKRQFCVHGIPKSVRSDCGSQFMSTLFKEFCDSYGITHTPASPHYQRSNGLAERAIQTVKRLWKKCKDKHLAILDYNTTPLEGINRSPAQLLMGRRPRNLIPAADACMKPITHNDSGFQKYFIDNKTKQKRYHDRKGVKELNPLQPKQSVYVSPLPGTKRWFPATIVRQHHSPRSYVLENNGQLYRRNRQHLRPFSGVASDYRTFGSNEDEDSTDDNPTQTSNSTCTQTINNPFPSNPHNPRAVTTRSGRTVKPPNRYGYD